MSLLTVSPFNSESHVLSAIEAIFLGARLRACVLEAAFNLTRFAMAFQSAHAKHNRPCGFLPLGAHDNNRSKFDDFQLQSARREAKAEKLILCIHTTPSSVLLGLSFFRTFEVVAI